ncbi:MAG: DUF3592 domain-containing protein [Vulcanimicrobiota bacterium]
MLSEPDRFLYSGLMLGKAGYDTIVRQEARRNWPVEQGVVKKTFVQKSSTRSTRYFARVQFSYTVGKQTYTGIDTISNFQIIDDAEMALRVYPIGKEVIVHYNSKEPHDAVLFIMGNDGTYIFLFIFSIIAILFGVAVISGLMVKNTDKASRQP